MRSGPDHPSSGHVRLVAHCTAVRCTRAVGGTGPRPRCPFCSTAFPLARQHFVRVAVPRKRQATSAGMRVCVTYPSARVPPSQPDLFSSFCCALLPGLPRWAASGGVFEAIARPLAQKRHYDSPRSGVAVGIEAASGRALPLGIVLSDCSAIIARWLKFAPGVPLSV